MNVGIDPLWHNIPPEDSTFFYHDWYLVLRTSFLPLFAFNFVFKFVIIYSTALQILACRPNVNLSGHVIQLWVGTGLLCLYSEFFYLLGSASLHFCYLILLAGNFHYTITEIIFQTFFNSYSLLPPFTSAYNLCLLKKRLH